MDKNSNWRCDKCQNVYDTYKEAEEHEKLCSGVSNDQQTWSENKKEVAKTSGFAFGPSVPTHQLLWQVVGKLLLRLLHLEDQVPHRKWRVKFMVGDFRFSTNHFGSRWGRIFVFWRF